MFYFTNHKCTYVRMLKIKILKSMNKIMTTHDDTYVICFLRQFPACKGRSSSYIAKNMTVIP